MGKKKRCRDCVRGKDGVFANCDRCERRYYRAMVRTFAAEMPETSAQFRAYAKEEIRR